MDQNQAVQILVNVALLAQAKGVLSLEDAVVVKQAVDIFRPKKEDTISDAEIVEDSPKKKK